MQDFIQRPLKIFLCHAAADKPAVRNLYRYLQSKGMEPWLDEFKLLAGQKWREEIPKALYSSDVIIVVLSQNSVTKEGYVQREIKFALDKALDMPEGRIFLIPARLDECEVPESLKGYHWVDLFQRNWHRRLMSSLNERAVQLGLTSAPTSPAETQPPVTNLQYMRSSGSSPTVHSEPDESSIPAKQLNESLQVTNRDGEQNDGLSRAKESQHTQKQLISVEIPEVTRKFDTRVLGRILGISLIIVFLGWAGNVIIKNWTAFNSPGTLPTPKVSLSVTTVPQLTVTRTSQPTETNTPSPPGVPTPSIPALLISSTMISEIDGMTLVYVPAGEFVMGIEWEDAMNWCEEISPDCGMDWFRDEGPPEKFDLQAFWMDKTEVSNEMFAKCVQDGDCNQPSDTTHYDDPNYANHPVVYVSWKDATAYCTWASRRLPTEAEWEKAASWNPVTDEKFVFPWGNHFDCKKGNFDDETLRDGYVVQGGENCDGFPGTSPVGSFPPGVSPYGLLDMAGNVAEWVSSSYMPYPYTRRDNRREDLTSSDVRVLRGGGAKSSEEGVRTTARGFNGSSYTNDYLGFRCSVSP